MLRYVFRLPFFLRYIFYVKTVQNLRRKTKWNDYRSRMYSRNFSKKFHKKRYEEVIHFELRLQPIRRRRYHHRHHHARASIQKNERMIKIIKSWLSNLQDEIVIAPTTTTKRQNDDDDDESIPRHRKQQKKKPKISIIYVTYAVIGTVADSVNRKSTNVVASPMTGWINWLYWKRPRIF